MPETTIKTFSSLSLTQELRYHGLHHDRRLIICSDLLLEKMQFYNNISIIFLTELFSTAKIKTQTLSHWYENVSQCGSEKVVRFLLRSAYYSSFFLYTFWSSL